MRHISLLAATLIGLAAVAGCDDPKAAADAGTAKSATASATTAASSAPAAASSPAAAASSAPAASASGSAAAGAMKSVGVKDCDEYIKEAEACYGTMPAAAKDPMEKALKTQHEAWEKLAASGEAGKKGLEAACKAALDGLAKNPACKKK